MTPWIATAGLIANATAAISSFKLVRVLSAEEACYKTRDYDKSNSRIEIRSLLSLTKSL